MPSKYSNEIFSYFIKQNCIELNTYKNYVIYPNIGYTLIDKNNREKKKLFVIIQILKLMKKNLILLLKKNHLTNNLHSLI